MNIIFIPKFGASGATMSFSFMCILWFIYIVEVFRRDSDFHFSEIIIPHYSDFINIFSRIEKKLGRSET